MKNDELSLMDIHLLDGQQKRLKEEIKTMSEFSYKILDILDDIKHTGEVEGVLKLENLEDINKIKYLLGKLEVNITDNMKRKIREINQKL